MSKHEIELVRLNRAIGQLDGIKKMINNERYCVEILTQLKAVRQAVKCIELNVLKRHMESCLISACNSGEEELIKSKIAEISNLIEKF